MDSDGMSLGIFDANAYHEFYIKKFNEKSDKKSAHTHCIVPRCKTNGNSVIDGKYINFVCVPSNQKEKWLVAIHRMEDSTFTLKPSSRVCSRHFIDTDFEYHGFSKKRTLKSGVIPHEFEHCWSNVPHLLKQQKARPLNRLVAYDTTVSFTYVTSLQSHGYWCRTGRILVSIFHTCFSTCSVGEC